MKLNYKVDVKLQTRPDTKQTVLCDNNINITIFKIYITFNTKRMSTNV